MNTLQNIESQGSPPVDANDTVSEAVLKHKNWDCNTIKELISNYRQSSSDKKTIISIEISTEVQKIIQTILEDPEHKDLDVEPEEIQVFMVVKLILQKLGLTEEKPSFNGLDGKDLGSSAIIGTINYDGSEQKTS